MSDPSQRVAVIGGGVSGLMAAWELSQAGVEVDLLEAADRLGGLASSFDFDGFSIERFYHFICRSDLTLLSTAERLGLADRVRWRRTKTGYFYQGRHYPFSTSFDLLRFSPLPPADRLRFALNVFRASRASNWKELESMGAKEWLLENVGEHAYNVIWHPLLRTKFHSYYDEISAAWLWHRIHRVARSRPSPFHAESFGHFIGGSDLIIQTLARRAEENGARIRLRSPVDRIEEEDGSCVGVRINGELERYDAVICALPLTLVPRLLPDACADYRDRLSELESIGVVCMILRLKQSLTDNFWLNVHDDRIAFNGVIEYSNLNEDDRLEGRSIVYVPFYMERDHERFSVPDGDLFREYCDALALVNPQFDESWVESYRVFRAPHAQPICDIDFSHKVPAIETPLPSLYLIESTQLYPADRIISGNLRLAQDAVHRVLRGLGKDANLPFSPIAPGEIPA